MRLGPLGTWELLIILAVVLLIFGPRRLPRMARGIGESIREFRKELRIMKGEIDTAGDEERSGKKAASSSAPESEGNPSSGGTAA
jgi:sec-independent protein translocase protein TatA